MFSMFPLSLPDDSGNIENNYFIHVLETTADFSRENKVFWVALKLHMQMLKKLSHKDAIVPQYGTSVAMA